MSGEERRYIVVDGLTPLSAPTSYDAAEDYYHHECDRRNGDPYVLLAVLNEAEHRAAVKSAREASWRHGLAWTQDDVLAVWAGQEGAA